MHGVATTNASTMTRTIAPMRFAERSSSFSRARATTNARASRGGDEGGGKRVTKASEELAEKFTTLQNSVGAVPGPWDCFLTLRGIKTLAVRMARHDENAKALVAWMRERDDVAKVIYPGFGGMVSFVLKGDLDAAVRFVKATKIFILAESLGGVESLIELPAIMTHASVPPDVRASIGIDDGLIRLSVGIEHIDDQRADLERAFAAAKG